MPYSIMMDAGHGEHRLRQFKKSRYTLTGGVMSVVSLLLLFAFR